MTGGFENIILSKSNENHLEVFFTKLILPSSCLAHWEPTILSLEMDVLALPSLPSHLLPLCLAHSLSSYYLLVEFLLIL